jgi:hypothetical protein
LFLLLLAAFAWFVLRLCLELCCILLLLELLVTVGLLNAEAVEILDTKSKQAMHDNSLPPRIDCCRVVLGLWLIITIVAFRCMFTIQYYLFFDDC